MSDPDDMDERPAPGEAKDSFGERTLLPDGAAGDVAPAAAAGSFPDLTGAPPEVGAAGAFAFATEFEIIEKIGAGGMGEVYLALETRLDRKVALKRIKGESGSVARLLREARAAARLSHPNIVTVLRVDEDDEGPFIVMEYVEGESLAEILSGLPGGLPEDLAARLFRMICEGISHAHEEGVVHRDIKPANVMVTRKGIAKLADFGLARIGAVGSLSVVGRGMGSLRYMAPEQSVDASSVDERSDIYSLGCTLYEMLTGKLPPPHPDPVPLRWRNLVLKATRPESRDRFSNVKEMIRELDAALGKPSVAIVAAEGVCPGCGRQSGPQELHCVSCGESLMDACPACRDETRVGSVFCGRCGVDIPAHKEVARRSAVAAEHRKARRLSEAEDELTGILEYAKGTRLKPESAILVAAGRDLRSVREMREQAAEDWREGEEAEARERYEAAREHYLGAAGIDVGLGERAEERKRDLDGRLEGLRVLISRIE